MPEIDAVNVQLLTLLQEDGRMTNAKLADNLGMSETPCWRRLKRLEESGIIEGYQANLNRRKSAEALQAAIWELEDERMIENTTGDQDVRDLANYYVDTLAQQLADLGLGERVRILNMYRADNGAASQDVLVLVPLPQAGALAAMGLAGVAVRRRSRR